MYARPAGMTASTRDVEFAVRGEHITLDALLKAVGAADSGGAAKALVAAGAVQVDGRPESRKTRKLRGGETVTLAGWRIRLHRHGAAE